MKTFTFKQAVEVLNTYFKGHRILKVWDTIRELEILFCDATGKQWELYTSGDDYFQRVEDFVIIPA